MGTRNCLYIQLGTKEFYDLKLTAANILRIAVSRQWTFPRTKQVSTGHLLTPVCALVPSFQVHLVPLPEKTRRLMPSGLFWQGHKDLNPEPTVLETAALPIELYPYLYKRQCLYSLVGPQGFEPGTIRL